MKIYGLGLLLGDLSVVALVTADDKGDFCVYYYKKPNFKEECSFICASLEKGSSAGSPRGNMPVVGSFKAPEWLSVTIFDNYYYHGNQQPYVGSVARLETPSKFHSVKYKNIS
ncbi:uncharacterized protein VTP21DRAFT_5330 [Calcarisporiella thermophila]|uniref:uncharacterized protein n=1 Tax=Calcarisporiella thermophila TaxID=911321 RepID=UPI0037423935